jgi:hypothetical protein
MRMTLENNKTEICQGKIIVVRETYVDSAYHRFFETLKPIYILQLGKEFRVT